MRQQACKADTDYYSVLQVRPTASRGEIRASFKRLVLEHHPDKNPDSRDSSERRVRELIEAYEILGNPRSRAEFDRRRQAVLLARRAATRGSERPFFFHRTDPGSRALMVLHFLLHRQPEDASELLLQMEASLGKTFLRDYLERRDYLDCLFLLGEFYLGRREYSKALERLRAFYQHEARSRFPRHYAEQVRHLLKDLYLNKLPRWEDAESALAGLREAANLGLTEAEEALRLRRMAEALVDLGSVEEARRVLEGAEARFPSSAEIRKVRRLVDKRSSLRRRPSQAAWEGF